MLFFESAFTARDVVGAVRAASRTGILPHWEPVTAAVGIRDKRPPPTSDDELRAWLASARSVSIDGADHRNFLSFDSSHGSVKCQNLVERFPGLNLDVLSSIKFTYYTYGSRHPEWTRRDSPVYDRAPSAAIGHWRLGWAFAIQGDGHDRLVSRRWLEHGPWLLERGPNDTSLILFHDERADAVTAAAQAEPGHRWLKNYVHGGLVSDEKLWRRPDRVISHPVRGIYVAQDRSLRVVVHGRPVHVGEMLEAAAMKLYAPRPDQPVESVRYVFMSESEARAHLHDLWLRGLECYAIVGGVEVRLDDTYVPPPPVKPAWVHEMAARRAG